MRQKVRFQRFDKVLFFAPIIVFLVGLLSVYSASFKAGQPLDQSLAIRQMEWMLMAVILVFWGMRFDYFHLQDWAWPLYFLSLILLVGVMFTPARLGARRWIDLGPVNFQPSELAKISVILVLAKYFAAVERPEFLSTRKRLVPFVVVVVPFLLIVKEPDLGTALLLVPILFSMLYVWGFPVRRLLWLLGSAALLSPFLFFFLKDYQKARLLVFVNPNSDPLGAGYTIIQSKIAIGSGGFFGKGFLGGTQNYLHFLPERHTDFIFAVIGEEGGLFLGSSVILLFSVIIWKGFQISEKCPERFGRLLACGITALIASQALINIGMTMGVLPVVGVPLPLVSYGGTSVLMTMISIGILLNIKVHQPLF